MRKVMMLCAAAIVTGAVGCGSKKTSPTDGASDRRDVAADVVVDAGPGDLPQESRDGQDARDGSDAGDASGDTRDGSDAGDASGDTRDGPADKAVADAITDGVDAADAGGDVGDLPVDAAVADGLADAIVDAADAGDDGAPSDTPVEARPYVERDCAKLDACVCASNETCSFTCPGGDCDVTCAAGSSCTVTCAAPFGCSIGCGSDASCVLACNAGLCWHFSGPARTLACDPAGTGCI